MSFSLLPAEVSDVSALASVGRGAPQTDTHTQFKIDYSGYNHAETMKPAIESWILRPPTRCRIVKAVDDTSGKIVGYVAWGFRGYDSASDNQNTVSGSATRNPPAGGQDKAKTTNDDKPDAAFKPLVGVARLGEITDTDMQRWMAKLMPEGTKCMFIHSIVVEPAYQGHGIGTAFLRDGLSQADRDGVFCWVHSSEAGYTQFRKAGFEEVGRLEVDLDEFAAEEEQKKADAGSERSAGGDASEVEAKRYGTYTFKYMKRLPSTSTST